MATLTTLPISISLPKGDSRTISVTAYRVDGTTPLPLTGAQITMTVKKRANDAAPVFTRKNTAAGGSDAEVVITGELTGHFSVLLVPANTAALEPGSYAWDIVIAWPPLQQYTVAVGTLHITEHPFI